MSIRLIVEPQELPPLKINAMAPISMQYILKFNNDSEIFEKYIEQSELVCTMLTNSSGVE